VRAPEDVPPPADFSGYTGDDEHPLDTWSTMAGSAILHAEDAWLDD
jgi:hypothetical protein